MVLETLANTVLSRFEDVLYVEFLAQNPSIEVSKRNKSMDFSPISIPGSSWNPQFIPQIAQIIPNATQYMPNQIYDNSTKARNK